jgi:3-deoxy-manno-octulosonate cytidylyltransferase (CMP-KDO synthetase)
MTPQPTPGRTGGVLAVIPARFASTRLPGKPLLDLTGTPLIVHVVEAARKSRRLGRIVVATDDRRIFDVVRACGAEAMMTRDDHPSGTDRVAEVAAAFPDARIVVNLQGDEPEIEPAALDAVVDLLERDWAASMATIATPIRDESVFRDPSCVKVVLSASGRALYFSRSPIPMHRDGAPTDEPLGLLHLGLYAYRRDFLLKLATLPPSPLERAEKLEQLRVLESGEPIAVGVVDERSVGIDTPEDYRRFVERWNHRRAPAA